MIDIEFNGHTGREIGLALATRPSVPPPQMRGEWVDLGAVDGSMLSTDGTYENIEILCELNCVCPPDRVGAQYRRAKAWIQGAGELSFTDDSEIYYRVKAAGIAEFTRRSRTGADLIASFICDPYCYLKSGKYPIKKTFRTNNTVQDQINIPHVGSVARPIYKITGGTSTTSAVLNVNNRTVSMSRTDGLTIDVERMIAYNSNGAQSHATTGDFDNLVLDAGLYGYDNIKITGNSRALTLELIPNWRQL